MSEQSAPDTTPVSDTKSENTYKKSSRVKWLLIYAVLGLLIYGIIYYFFIYTKSSGDQNALNKEPSQGQEKAASEKTTVVLTNTGFDPKTIKVKTGTEVVWLNNSGRTATVNSSVHPTHMDYPPLNLGDFKNGESLSLVFDSPGTFKYHNHLDASETGEVIVE